MTDQFPKTTGEQFRKTLERFGIVVIFSIAFAYIEAAVVVYLRTIFHPDGFTFPLTTFGIDPKWERLLLTEIGREAATMVLILTGAWLSGRRLRQRFAYVMIIFAVWDIFYYLWLKVFLDWPASIMDWDILFLIPVTWAGPVLAPVLVSVTMLVFAAIILYRDWAGAPIKASAPQWIGFVLAGLIVVLSFCMAGRHVAEPQFHSGFYWSLFALGEIAAIALFLRCLLKSKKR
ncbi:MAG: hypothetical protein ACYTEL_23655 [Planctomycetota bacterium]